MGLQKRGAHWFGEGQDDIQRELTRYSGLTGYTAERFADARCGCGGILFALELDEAAGVAVRGCAACGDRRAMADGAAYLSDADLQSCACPCGRELFELTVGVSLYANSADVRWLYVGARCPACGLTACYGDWKNEYQGADALLAQV